MSTVPDTVNRLAELLAQVWLVPNTSGALMVRIPAPLLTVMPAVGDAGGDGQRVSTANAHICRRRATVQRQTLDGEIPAERGVEVAGGGPGGIEVDIGGRTGVLVGIRVSRRVSGPIGEIRIAAGDAVPDIVINALEPSRRRSGDHRRHMQHHRSIRRD